MGKNWKKKIRQAGMAATLVTAWGGMAPSDADAALLELRISPTLNTGRILLQYDFNSTASQAFTPLVASRGTTTFISGEVPQYYGGGPDLERIGSISIVQGDTTGIALGMRPDLAAEIIGQKNLLGYYDLVGVSENRQKTVDEIITILTNLSPKIPVDPEDPPDYDSPEYLDGDGSDNSEGEFTFYSIDDTGGLYSQIVHSEGLYGEQLTMVNFFGDEVGAYGGHIDTGQIAPDQIGWGQIPEPGTFFIIATLGGLQLVRRRK